MMKNIIAIALIIYGVDLYAQTNNKSFDEIKMNNNSRLKGNHFYFLKDSIFLRQARDVKINFMDGLEEKEVKINNNKIRLPSKGKDTLSLFFYYQGKLLFKPFINESMASSIQKRIIFGVIGGFGEIKEKFDSLSEKDKEKYRVDLIHNHKLLLHGLLMSLENKKYYKGDLVFIIITAGLFEKFDHIFIN